MNFSEQQKSQLMLIAVFGVILLCIVGYYHFFVGRPKIQNLNRQASSVQSDIEQKTTELEEIRTLLAQRDRLEKRRRVINKVVRRLPSRPDAPGFLVALVSILRQTGIIQRYVTPEQTANRSQYTEIPYEVGAFGRYHELGQFLTLVEQNPQRFMRVKDLQISNNLNRPSIHPITLQISTFMFNRRAAQRAVR